MKSWAYTRAVLDPMLPWALVSESCPVWISAPAPGSQPLNVAAPVQRWLSPFTPAAEPQVITFGDRWSSTDPREANALFMTTGKYGVTDAPAGTAPAK